MSRFFMVQCVIINLWIYNIAFLMYIMAHYLLVGQ